METNTQLVKKEELGDQSFIERLVSKADSLEQIKEVGMVIINSGFCPDHFKTSKDAVGVIMCIEAGKKLGITWMQALSDIYPVKGRVGMMGTLAKSLIFSSGVCEKWEETTEGTYPNPDYKHIIVSKRKGYPGEFRTEFSVFDAKMANLMDKSIYKAYGKRMIMWRNVGFHAQDYYTDLMKGMKTVEELNDYDPANIGAGTPGETTIITRDGQKMKIDLGKTAKSEIISQGVKDSIDKANNKHKEAQDVEAITSEAEDLTPSSIEIKEWTEEYLTGLKADIGQLAKDSLPDAKYKLMLAIPQKKTNKLFREALLAFQDGKLDAWLTNALKVSEIDSGNGEGQSTAPIENIPQNSDNEPTDDLSILDTKPLNAPTTAQATAAFESERKATPPAGTLFAEESVSDEGFIIGTIDPVTGKRGMMNAVKLYQHLCSIGIGDTSVPGGLDNFCKTASEEAIQILIQKNM
jgi:hypothetical protein